MKKYLDSVTTKIEDESEDDVIFKEHTKGSFAHSQLDKVTQIDQLDIKAAIQEIVTKRMHQYEKAMATGKVFDNMFANQLRSLESENCQLKQEMKTLKSKLEHYERSHLMKRKKRRRSESYDLNENPPQTIVSSHEPLHQPFLDQDQSAPPAITKSSITRCHNVLNQDQRPPVQTVAPVQNTNNQPLLLRPHFYETDPRHCFSGVSVSGVNTQVVAANEGLRMTSIARHSPCAQRFSSHSQLSKMNGYSNGFERSLSHTQNGSQIGSNETIFPHQQIPDCQQAARYPPTTYQPTHHQTNGMRYNSNRHEESVKHNLSLPRLKVSISASGSGIILTWDQESARVTRTKAHNVECYHLFAHQARNSIEEPPADVKQWKKIGVVNSLPLPMACTLTHFANGHVYFFTVCAVDVHGNEGKMSNPCIIRLNLDS